MLMGYSNTSIIGSYQIESLKNILINNGWNSIKCICVIIFTLLHFPCATTIISIKKETNSNKWTILSIIIPLLLGLTICLIINLVSKIFA